MPKVKIDALEVATDKGPQVVMADFIGLFAVHRSLRNPDFWSVTHIESGFAACSTLEEKENAEYMARTIETLADWNFTDAASVKAWPDEVTKRVTAAIRAIANADAVGALPPDTTKAAP